MSHMSKTKKARSTALPGLPGVAAIAASGTVWLMAVISVIVLNGGVDDRGRAQTPATSQDAEADYGYGPRYLNDAQRAGRDTWYFWTGGNEKFWVKMAELTEGNVNLLAYVDSRLHGRRFATLGAITQPGCQAATGPDEYGLWMDKCEQPEVPGVPGLRPVLSACVGLPTPSSTRRTGMPRSTSNTLAKPSRLTSSAWPAGSVTLASIRSTRRRIPKRRNGRTSLAPSETSIGKKAGCSTSGCRRPISGGTSATVNHRARRTRRALRRITSTIRTRSTPSSTWLTGRRSRSGWPTGRPVKCITSSRMGPIRSASRARRSASTSTSGCARISGSRCTIR